MCCFFFSNLVTKSIGMTANRNTAKMKMRKMYQCLNVALSQERHSLRHFVKGSWEREKTGEMWYCTASAQIHSEIILMLCATYKHIRSAQEGEDMWRTFNQEISPVNSFYMNIGKTEISLKLYLQITCFTVRKDVGIYSDGTFLFFSLFLFLTESAVRCRCS